MSTAVLEQELTIPEARAGGVSVRRLPEDHTRPSWYQEMQSAAWDAFEALPMPTRRDEAWRFATLKSVDLEPYAAPLEVDAAARERIVSNSVGLGKTSGRMVFANDQLLAQE